MNQTARLALTGVVFAAIAAGGWAFFRKPAEGSVSTASPSVAPSAQAGASASASAAVEKPAPPPTITRGDKQVDVLGPVYTIDKIYKSMMGPQSTRDVALLDETTPPELVWVTGIHAAMRAPDAETPMPEQFMCHVNVDLDPLTHDKAYGHHLPLSGRLFTLSQGQLEVKLPDGFGIPVHSNHPIAMTTQVLNLNERVPPFQVRHDVKLDYVRDAAAKKPMKPLYMAGVYGLALLKGDHGFFGKDKPAEHGTACMMGKAATGEPYVDPQGKEFTGHWVVKPGHEENHTNVTRMLDLQFDTTIHAIAVHLHPFAESLELVDLTTGKSVFKAKTRQLPGKIGLDHVDSYASEEGIPVYKGHDYELVSVYENTTKEDQDSMAVMLLYLHDKEFSRKASMEALKAPKDEAKAGASAAPSSSASAAAAKPTSKGPMK